MKKQRFYISTIAEDAPQTARRYGLGLEIAEYCTASNMDDLFPQTDGALRGKLAGIPGRVLHAPFNELFPCAIDPKARELARSRYRQAMDLARRYGAAKIVVHGGYHPRMYYPCWYTEQSVLFWREFLNEVPQDLTLCLENVLEEEPGMLLDIVRGADDPRLRLCLDVGHVNVYSKVSAAEWLNVWAPYLSHFHIHNNDGTWDTHGALNGGSLPMEALLKTASGLCPDATFTLETMEAEPSVRYLAERGILEA